MSSFKNMKAKDSSNPLNLINSAMSTILEACKKKAQSVALNALTGLRRREIKWCIKYYIVIFYNIGKIVGLYYVSCYSKCILNVSMYDLRNYIRIKKMKE